MTHVALPAYTAKVLDVIPWSDKSDAVYFRLTDDALALFTIQLLDHKETRRLVEGAEIPVHLSFEATEVKRSHAVEEMHTHQVCQFEPTGSRDSISTVSHEIHGQIKEVLDDRLILDCHRLVEVKLPPRLRGRNYQAGETVSARGKLHVLPMIPTKR